MTQSRFRTKTVHAKLRVERSKRQRGLRDVRAVEAILAVDAKRARLRVFFFSRLRRRSRSRERRRRRRVEPEPVPLRVFFRHAQQTRDGLAVAVHRDLARQVERHELHVRPRRRDGGGEGCAQPRLGRRRISFQQIQRRRRAVRPRERREVRSRALLAVAFCFRVCHRAPVVDELGGVATGVVQKQHRKTPARVAQRLRPPRGRRPARDDEGGKKRARVLAFVFLRPRLRLRRLRRTKHLAHLLRLHEVGDVPFGVRAAAVVAHAVARARDARDDRDDGERLRRGVFFLFFVFVFGRDGDARRAPRAAH